MDNSFITVTDRKNGKPVTINLRHVNVIRPADTGPEGGTHIGINNYGATGYNVLEGYTNVLDMLPGNERAHA